MGIFSGLAKAKSAADLAEAKGRLETEMAGIATTLERLKSEIRGAPFDGNEASLDRLQAEIGAAEGRRMMLVELIDETEKRRAAAVQREADEVLDGQLAERQKIAGRLSKDYAALNKAALAWAEAATAITSERAALRQLNEVARAAGRPPLDDPLNEIRTRCSRPTCSAADPVAGATLPEYFPRHPDGPWLAEVLR